MLTRRSILQLMGLAPLGLGTASDPVLASIPPQSYPALPPGIDPAYCHRELIRYEHAPRAKVERFGISSISVPFATLPPHFYVRSPEEAGYKPDLTAFRRYLETEDVPWLRDRPLREVFRLCCRRLMARDAKWSTEVEELKRPPKWSIAWAKVHGKPLLLPSRVVTPRYTIDQAELTDYSLGWMLLRMAHGLVDEINCQMQLARAAYDAEHSLPPQILANHVPADVHMNRDSYMLDFHGWMVSQIALVP